MLLLDVLSPEPYVMASGLLLQGWHSAAGNKAGGNRTRWNGGECYHNHTAHDISEQPITHTHAHTHTHTNTPSDIH